MPSGSFFDLFPISVITTSTLDHLAGLAPESRFDERRFRMNVVVRTHGDGFVENEWVGRSLALGHGARLGVALPDPRCVMTTLPQGDLPKDVGILRTAATHNQVNVGVYANVLRGGTIRHGDRVRVES